MKSRQPSHRYWQSVRDPLGASQEGPEVRVVPTWLHVLSCWSVLEVAEAYKNECTIHVPRPPVFFRGSGKNAWGCI